MIAASRGKVAEVRELLDMAADPTIQNDQGLTALEVVRNKFGGQGPSLLQYLLDPA